MEDGEVVGGDEQVNGIAVVLGVPGAGQGPADQAARALAQGTAPAFNVAGLALVLGAAAVRSGRESGPAGAPRITAAGTTPGRLRVIDSIDDGCFHVVVSGWRPDMKLRVYHENVPDALRSKIWPGQRLHARVNTGAETAADLYFFDWEID